MWSYFILFLCFILSFNFDGRYNRIGNSNDDRNPEGNIHPYPIGNKINSKYQEYDSDLRKCETRLAIIRSFTFLIFIHLFAFLLGSPNIRVIEKEPLFFKLKIADNKCPYS